jgi:hypothetical protein
MAGRFVFSVARLASLPADRYFPWPFLQRVDSEQKVSFRYDPANARPFAASQQ